jgi:hypothetical protein
MVSDGKIYKDASKVRAVDGKVQVDGPDAVDVDLTPEAAEETSDRLIHEAIRASGQRRMKQLEEKSKGSGAP